jgi:hypothetical protein
VGTSSGHRLRSMGRQPSALCDKGRSRNVRRRIILGKAYPGCRVIRSGQLLLGERAARSSRSLMPLGLCNAARVWTYHRSTPSAKRMVHRAAPHPAPPPYPCLLAAHKRPTEPFDGSGQREPRPRGGSLPVLSWVSRPCGAEIKCLQLAGAAWCTAASTALGLRCGSTRVPCVRGCPADTQCGRAPRNMEGRRLSSSRRSRNLRRPDR